MNTPTFTGAYTCTHHNDQQRAACPVCLVTALTVERDQLRAEVKSCGELSCDECNARTAALTAERDSLRAEVERADALYQKACEVEHELRAKLERLRSDRDCEKRLRKDADEFRENAIARAERAEDNLAALEQCHDDNCRGVAKIADDLAAERARLDWLESPAGFDWQWNSAHSVIVRRSAIDAAMKEDAK